MMQLFTSAPKALAEEQDLDGGIASVECVNSNQRHAMITWFIRTTNGGVLVGDSINFTFQPSGAFRRSVGIYPPRTQNGGIESSRHVEESVTMEGTASGYNPANGNLYLYTIPEFTAICR